MSVYEKEKQLEYYSFFSLLFILIYITWNKYDVEDVYSTYRNMNNKSFHSEMQWEIWIQLEALLLEKQTSPSSVHILDIPLYIIYHHQKYKNSF